VYKVALFTATTWSRSQRRRSDRFVQEEHAQFESQKPTATEPKRQWLEETIRTLPVDDRAIVISSLEGYSHAEIAEITGFSASNVGVRLHRIRQRLTELAKEHFDEY
jgi:RNA polymerase sigma-70 factor (ECF subfamily)